MAPSRATPLDEAKRGIVTVGGGRGFVVDGPCGLLIITAAHVLPHLPPALAICTGYERSYLELLAQLSDKPTVMAECLFVDLVADIAVLGSPDMQEFCNEAEAYEEFVEASLPLPIKDAAETEVVWLLSLDGEWFKADAKTFGGPIWLDNATAGIMDGMSGSPIVTNEGEAIGVVCSASKDSATDGDKASRGGPEPRLMHSLPGRLVCEQSRS